ncbi:hypothetical protein J6590_080858 [Homalodisca vitripennis]|nr:hypothetical protein J6590_080858 [Homalodisca vitripennis]
MADHLLTEDDILNALNDRSEADAKRECPEEEHNVEYHELSDEYDSDADPEYIPDEEDLLRLENDNIDAIREIEHIQEVEEPTTTRPKIAQATFSNRNPHRYYWICAYNGHGRRFCGFRKWVSLGLGELQQKMLFTYDPVLVNLQGRSIFHRNASNYLLALTLLNKFFNIQMKKYKNKLQ